MTPISNFTSIEQVTGQYLNQTAVNKSNTNADNSFESILKDKLFVKEPEGLKFSKHASQRLETRGINLSEDQSQRLTEGVAKASQKGINDSLIMVDSLAFIVNVPNSTVITAIDQNDADQNIFTNIDGAVIA